MYKTVNLLFVCSGNIFRSLAAGRLFQKYLDEVDEERFKVRTAGTAQKLEEGMDPKTVDVLSEYKVDVSSHQRQPMTEEIIEWADTILAMADYHQEELHEQYGVYAHLFNDFAREEKTNVKDVGDAFSKETPSRTEVETHIEDTIAYLSEVIPQLTKNLQHRHFLFREFVTGDRSTHLNGAAFKPLLENKRAMAFLSLDVPEALENHVLVVPKERFRYLDEIPSDIKRGMFVLADTLGEFFRTKAEGYNLFVNNGGAAGQHIFHTHIHIIPRHFADKIDVEAWEHERVDADIYDQYQSEMQNQLNSFLEN